MKFKKIVTIFIVVIIIIMVSLILIKQQSKNKENNLTYETKISSDKVENNNDEKITEVKSATAYYTVQACINKYISYILENDSESVYRILDTDYIAKKGITEKNVFDKIDYISEQVSFEATKMYVEELDENNNKYYVSGVLKQDSFGYAEETKILYDNFNVAVVLNLEDMIFSIIPLEDGGVFNER